MHRCQAVDTYKEDGFELQSFDVLDIEHAYIVILTHDLTVRAGNNPNTDIGKCQIQPIGKVRNFSFTSYKDSY